MDKMNSKDINEKL